jgi:hypothetical protein
MTLLQDLGLGGKDMSDKQIADFAMFGGAYGPFKGKEISTLLR